jgi:5'-nucleotidase
MGPYPTKVQNLDQKTTYIVQAYRFGQFMGKVDLEFNDENDLISLGGEPILLDNTISKHEETDIIVKKWRIDFDAQTKHVVGEAIDNFPFSSCKISNTPLVIYIYDKVNVLLGI